LAALAAAVCVSHGNGAVRGEDRKAISNSAVVARHRFDADAGDFVEGNRARLDLEELAAVPADTTLDAIEDEGHSAHTEETKKEEETPAGECAVQPRGDSDVE